MGEIVLPVLDNGAWQDQLRALAWGALRVMRRYFAGVPPDRFPNIVALPGEMFSIDVDERFRLGLDILIRGIGGYATPPA